MDEDWVYSKTNFFRMLAYLLFIMPWFLVHKYVLLRREGQDSAGSEEEAGLIEEKARRKFMQAQTGKDSKTEIWHKVKKWVIAQVN